MELHAHTWWSQDCGVRPHDLCQAALGAGIDVLAVTDHNQIGGALEARDSGLITVIVGEEIRTAVGEVLAYFIEDWIPPGLSPDETIARIKDQGGLVSIPHPCDSGRNSTMQSVYHEQVFPQLDMVEVFNSRVIDQAHNRAAAALCAQHGKVPAVGSDAHTRREVGASYQQIDQFAGPTQFLAAMANAGLQTQISGSHVRLASNFQKIRKRLFGPDVPNLRRP